MKSDNVIVVSCTDSYVPSLEALLNSLWYYHRDTIAVIVLSYGIRKEFIKREWPLEIEFIDISFDIKSEKQLTIRSQVDRYKFAAEIRGKTVMLIDADYYFTASIQMYFDIAKAGFIVAAGNGRNVTFGSPTYTTSGNIEKHKEYASKFVDTLSTYKKFEDMINLGAYKQGSNFKVDFAIKLIERIKSYLKQDMHNLIDYPDSLQGLYCIFDEVTSEST